MTAIPTIHSLIANMAEGIGFGTILPQAITFAPLPASSVGDGFVQVRTDGRIDIDLDTDAKTMHRLFSWSGKDFNVEGADPANLEAALRESIEKYDGHAGKDEQAALNIAVERLGNPTLYTATGFAQGDFDDASLMRALSDIMDRGSLIVDEQPDEPREGVLKAAAVAAFFYAGLAYLKHGMSEARFADDRSDMFAQWIGTSLDDAISFMGRHMTQNEDGLISGKDLIAALTFKSVASELWADWMLFDMAQAIKAEKTVDDPVTKFQNSLRLYNEAAAAVATVHDLHLIMSKAVGSKGAFDEDVTRIRHKSTKLFVSLFDQSEAFAGLG